MSSYHLDRSAFKAHTVEDAADYSSYYKKLTWLERLEVSAYLISAAFDYDLENPPKLDRTEFQAKSREQ